VLTQTPPPAELVAEVVTRSPDEPSTDRERGMGVQCSSAPTAKAGTGGVGGWEGEAGGLEGPGASCVARSDRQCVSLEQGWPGGVAWMVMGKGVPRRGGLRAPSSVGVEVAGERGGVAA
jgi:hypothetical protein